MLTSDPHKHMFCTHTGMHVRVQHVPLVRRCPQRLENFGSPGVTSSRELHDVDAAEAGAVSILYCGAISPAPDFVFSMVLGNLQCFLLQLLVLAFLLASSLLFFPPKHPPSFHLDYDGSHPPPPNELHMFRSTSWTAKGRFDVTLT